MAEENYVVCAHCKLIPIPDSVMRHLETCPYAYPQSAGDIMMAVAACYVRVPKSTATQDVCLACGGHEIQKQAVDAV